MEPAEKECLECGEALKGRIDKKFCSDECRSSYNNKLNSDATNLARNINNALRKNRRILKQLNPEGKAKVHRDKLVAKGFNFHYITNIYEAKNGNSYRFCYEQGYREVENQYLILVERQEYVE